MQNHCVANELSFRPHTKTHKSVEIAKLQIQYGATGICCAKLAEAETMSHGGIENILVTSPVVTEAGIRRAIELHKTTSELLLVIDNPEVASQIDRCAKKANIRIDVLLDLDPGMHRTGIEPGPAALRFAQNLQERWAGLNFRGVQFYAGNLMHVKSYSERQQRYFSTLEKLQGFVDKLHQSGIECPIVSGGGTGSYEFDFASGIMNELQAGSYAFMDRQYLEIESASGSSLEFEASLYVQTTVVSSNQPLMATTDAGLKSFSTDDKEPLIVDGAPPDSRYSFMGDEHGCVRWDDSAWSLEVGNVVRTIVPHCDPTINLYDNIHVVEDDKLIDIWSIDARGHSF